MQIQEKKKSTQCVIWVLLFFLLLGKVNIYTNITVYKCAYKSSTILKKKNFNLRASLWAIQEEKATTSYGNKKAYIQGPENEGEYKRRHAQEGCKVKACGEAPRSLWQWPGSPPGTCAQHRACYNLCTSRNSLLSEHLRILGSRSFLFNLLLKRYIIN